MVWSELFEAYGTKIVSKTDKAKSAYVPNEGQRRVLGMAGLRPSNKSPYPIFSIAVLFDPAVSTVQASYYNSARVGAGRAPEARMGHGFISSWLEEGDEVVIGFLAGELFAARTRQASQSTEEAVGHLITRAAPHTVMYLARLATGKPARRQVTREDFVRNPFVVGAAKIRADGRCEMPGCRRPLFAREDNTRYLEVHHVVPLSEGGEDTLANAAALCPHCHRELHFGVDRLRLRRKLQNYISSLQP
jgi:hypothetical protein